MIVRASFTLGGGGQRVRRGPSRSSPTLATRALEISPVSEILIEESIAGWKEFELEVMRDGDDNGVIVCSIENVDPMGVHTGDSITVAPQQTLTDREYQRMRDAALQVLRVIGVETGGSNVQFAVDPVTGRQVLIEMNPRVSRSSALASKATGFPIAKIAALLAVGYRLDEITNDITGETPVSFEPTLDYVVVKIPRFAFEKFPEADPHLTSTMKSVGEVMAIGRTFKEALGKAWRGIEKTGFDLGSALVRGDRGRLEALARRHRATGCSSCRPPSRRAAPWTRSPRPARIDPWFVDQIAEIVEEAAALRGRAAVDASSAARAAGARSGSACPTPSLAMLTGPRPRRPSAGTATRWGSRRSSRPSTRAPASSRRARRTTTPPTRRRSEVLPAARPRVVILGAGPNRIGQGIEFDYACVHAAFALEEAGFESVMVNSNPETVSTDYDTSSRLYFEPLSPEDVLAVCRAERPVGVIAQLGGQTPVALGSHPAGGGLRRSRARRPTRSTSPRTAASSREVLAELEIPAPPHGEARTHGRGPRHRRADRVSRWWSGRRTCWAGARWRSCTTPTTSRRSSGRLPRPRPIIRC